MLEINAAALNSPYIQAGPDGIRLASKSQIFHAFTLGDILTLSCQIAANTNTHETVEEISNPGKIARTTLKSRRFVSTVIDVEQTSNEERETTIHRLVEVFT